MFFRGACRFGPTPFVVNAGAPMTPVTSQDAAALPRATRKTLGGQGDGAAPEVPAPDLAEDFTP
jgi:hypothetical protein